MKKLFTVLIVVLVIFASVNTASAEKQNIGKIKVPAVTSDGKGVLTEVEVEIISGKGRILLNTEPFGGVQLQNSERVAVSVAKNLTGKNTSDKDIIISFKAAAFVVDGPSAGAAITAAVISALEGKPLRNDTTSTGTIQPDGSIGPVSSIFEKAQAAHSFGYKFFLISRGQELQSFNVETIKNSTSEVTTAQSGSQYKNITRYAAENWNLTIIQVSDIKDVYEIMINGKNGPVQNKINSNSSALLEKAIISDETEPMRGLAEQEIKKADQQLVKARTSLLRSELPEKGSEDALDLVRLGEKEIDSAKIALEHNYFYGAANHAFKATMLLKSAADIIEFNSLKTKEAQREFVQKRKNLAAFIFNKAFTKASDIEKYESDTGGYEWAVSAENRLAQADAQLDKFNEVENPLAALALVEGWSEISSSLYDISAESSSGKIFNKSNFKNESGETTTKVYNELVKFTLPPAGVYWLTEVANRETSKKWYIAAYTDNNIALSRIEAQRELNVRNFDNLEKFLEEKINSVDTKGSAWAKIYKDQAKLNLYYMKREQDSQLADDILIFVSQAKGYAELKEKINGTSGIGRQASGTGSVKVQKKPQTFTPYVLGAIGVLVVVLSYYEFFSRKRPAQNVKRKNSMRLNR